MKKWFEKQEERIDEKFKDISATMDKNQESLLTAFQNQKSEVQDQLNQLVQSVMVIGNSMKKQQGQINSLSKRQKADDNPSEGVKAGTPCQREAPAPSAKRRGVSQSAD
eukprot:12287509-Ditylum_brightwellii.AAC.1